MDEYMYVEALMLAPFFGLHVQYTAHGHCFLRLKYIGCCLRIL